MSESESENAHEHEAESQRDSQGGSENIDENIDKDIPEKSGPGKSKATSSKTTVKITAKGLLDLDFENFRVEDERAQSIRNLIALLKQEPWISDLKFLATELGQAVSESGEEGFQGLHSNSSASGETSSSQHPKLYHHHQHQQQQQQQPSQAQQNPSLFLQRYRAPEGHAVEGLCVEFAGAEMKVLWKDRVVLELTSLPKGQDFAVYFVNEELFLEFPRWMECLQDQMRDAKASKTQRAHAFKARFDKSASASTAATTTPAATASVEAATVEESS